MSIKPLTGLLLVLSIVAIPLFGHLDGPPLHLWDESRLAVNAFEMSQNNNWIVTKFAGSPEMWNTKPPLMIWLQAALVHLIGAGELAIRLPSALAALCTCLFIYLLFARKFLTPLLGVIVVLVLITSEGYVRYHGTRTGDYDSLLTMFMLGYSICYFLYLDESDGRYLTLTFLLLTLAALTKGIESLMFLPGLFIYTIYRQKLVSTLKQRRFYVGVAIFFICVAGVYMLRELYNPGYLHAVWQNEIGGRYDTVIENHKQDGWFYYNTLVNEGFREWYLLLIPGLFVGFLSKEKIVREITLFSVILVSTYLLVISNAATKLDWYIMPLMPFLSIIVGLLLYNICLLLSGFNYWKGHLSYNPLPFLFLFFVFVLPYQAIWRMALSKNYDLIEPDRMSMKLFLKRVIHRECNIDGCVLLNTGFSQDFTWYYEVLAQEQHIGLADEGNIPANGKIVVFDSASKSQIQKNYYAQKLQTFDSVAIYKLNGKR